MEALSRSIAMRKLKGKDLEILKKLVPEVEEKLRSGSGIEYHSILPPVSMHYAVDEEDFEERLKRLIRRRSDLSGGSHPGRIRMSSVHID